MIAYVPRERYLERTNKNRVARWGPKERETWVRCGKYGAIYNADLDTTRPAEPAEYKRRAKFKVMPDDILGPVEVRNPRGNKSIHPDIKPRTKIHNWTVGPKVHIEGRSEFRYRCTCGCKHKTVSYLRANDLLAGRSHGCLKCMCGRKKAAKNLTCTRKGSMV